MSQTLLSEGVDVNILDYKGATPLHRAKDAATVEVTWRFCLRSIIGFLFCCCCFSTLFRPSLNYFLLTSMKASNSLHNLVLYTNKLWLYQGSRDYTSPNHHDTFIYLSANVYIVFFCSYSLRQDQILTVKTTMATHHCM